MRPLGTTVLKNTVSNFVRAGASAIVALLLPHFLVHSLDRNHFAAWALMLQIGAYVNYLDFGVQTAVARYLAQAMERGDSGLRDRLISTSIALLSLGACVALLGTFVVLYFLPNIIHQAPASLIGELRTGAAVLMMGAAVLLPMSVFTGVLIGLYRNEVPAFAIGGSRLLGAVLILVAVSHTQSLVLLAGLLALANLAGALMQYFYARKLLPAMRISLSQVTLPMARELAKYCSTLTIWSLCMFLVNGLDLTIVGHYDFGAVGAYSIATMLITFLTGIGNSVYGALLAPMASLQERGDWPRIRRLVITTTRLGGFVSIVAVIAVFAVGRGLLRLWVGDDYASRVLPILEILMIANSVRLIAGPLSAALIATGQQRFGISGALSEGAANFSLSIVGAIYLGAAGVAWGTLAGAIIGIAWVAGFILDRLKTPILSRTELFEAGCLRPVLCLLPLIACVFYLDGTPDTLRRGLVFLVALACAGAVAWKWGNLRGLRSGIQD